MVHPFGFETVDKQTADSFCVTANAMLVDDATESDVTDPSNVLS